MSDELDPRDVVRRYNSRVGKSQDPFAVFQLKELRDRLVGKIEELESGREQYKVVVAGHKAVESDASEGLAGQIQQQIQEKQQEANNLAAFLQELLDAADDGEDLKEYIEAKQQEQLEELQRARQAQSGPQGPPGPM